MRNSQRLPNPRNVRLDASQLTELERIADVEKRTISSLLRVLVDEALKARRGRRVRTLRQKAA